MGRGVSNLLHRGWAQKHIWDSTWYVKPDPGMGWVCLGAILETACLKGEVGLLQENGAREDGHIADLG